MSTTGKNINLSALAKQASKIKVNKKLNTLEIKDSAYLKKKLEKVNKILAMSELPK